jgi:ATP-dependent Lhr-like helicase
VGRFTRELEQRCAGPGGPFSRRAQGEAWLREDHGLDAFAAGNLVDYLADQRAATGCLPTDRAITVERFRDELGDWRVCILSPFGAPVHAPWALAIEAGLSREAGFPVQALWSDDGIVLRLADAERAPACAAFLPDPDDVRERVVEQLAHSALFAGQFRENAARALLLPRRRPGARTPLFAQRLRAQGLLAVAQRFPSFPIVIETYRACLQDVFDLPGLESLLRGVRSGEIRADEVETRSASPFARSLVFAYTATYLYQGDTPLAERRAQALSLDRAMLRELLGEEELRDLLDAAVIEETAAALQGLPEERRARHADALHDLLLRVGDLTAPELRARCAGDPAPWLAALQATRRAVRLELAGEERWVAAEDAALYRERCSGRPRAPWSRSCCASPAGAGRSSRPSSRAATP